mmetsp:Transcript_7766/g.11318  ORF Transcript_7766/g.11318 Transcript_7766/m.11318 type:complete len:261 (+) Transcript_7766:54-836(+)|eukprot:CAMPEP_0195524962 /NCGR_PEP_ID=MMETSP0794_2-20130614/25105_1 /TAXON_ID=515487 /ORGANISM="Stephanopyxis turris, Strain CCMP 815" /LENGTH=260 /DNA_ID=CAMNT_0040655303 /DNA_START=54 /DNA_END=836 /DNA_ORIENTATION=+
MKLSTPSLCLVIALLSVPSPCIAFPVSISPKNGLQRTVSLITPVKNGMVGNNERNLRLHASLRPAAEPLLASGKALARSGELLVDTTTSLEMYGGALSAAGAGVRNAGDCVAQAAASCRFKTAAELVCDELREAGLCLTEASGKLKLAVEEAMVDDAEFAVIVESSIPAMAKCGTSLEAAGAGIMQRIPLVEIGNRLEEAGESLKDLSGTVLKIAEERDETKLSSQRMEFAGSKMIEAGNMLSGTPVEKPKGKGWLKGGL